MFAVVATSLFTAAACGGDDPVSYSEPVGIELKADADKVVTGSLTDDKGITTESGNPYGGFIANARTALDGASPSRIEVAEVSLLLGAGSTGVTQLGQIFAGNFEVLFEMNDTNDTVMVASGDGGTHHELRCRCAVLHELRQALVGQFQGGLSRSCHVYVRDH